MDTIELSGVVGICAAALLTMNIILGIGLSSSYKKLAIWQKIPSKYKWFKLVDIHNYTSYGVIALVFLHILILPLDSKTAFSYSDILWPIKVVHQPVFVFLGYLSLIALIIVIITTQKPIKKVLGTKIWRNIHVISYATGVLFIVHGIVMDPLLKDRSVDFIDAEKIFIELCGISIIVAFYWRYKDKQRKAS